MMCHTTGKSDNKNTGFLWSDMERGITAKLRNRCIKSGGGRTGMDFDGQRYLKEKKNLRELI